LRGHGLLGLNDVRGHLDGECDLEEQARAARQERGRRAEAPGTGGRLPPPRRLRHNGGDDRFVLVVWVREFWHMDSLADARILAVVVLGS
jgi:hypothetical protein